MVGGISEQAPQDRPLSMAEDELNLQNDPLKGSRARNGSECLGSFAATYTDPFVHYIPRSAGEHYAVLIEGGVLRAINMIDGTVATISGQNAAMKAALTASGAGRMAFTAVTVEDTTFIANKRTTVRMAKTKAPARPNQGIFYFRSAAYSTTYVMSISVDGTKYSATYTTPDNSDEGNAKFIQTSRLASEFAERLSKITGLKGKGFKFANNGSMIIVDGGNKTFSIDSKDGQGDTQLRAIKDWVRKFSDLPERAPSGYVVGVRGAAADQKDDYWVKFSGSGITGSWVEIPKPGTVLELETKTMPLILRNTGKGKFTLGFGKWGKRLAGDGVKTSKKPPFVDTTITTVHFIGGRFVIATGGTVSMSRSRNGYVFFPDTAQARLTTDPVLVNVQLGNVVDTKHSVAVSEKLFLWGHRTQVRLDSGDGPQSEENTEPLPSTAYEYDGQCAPMVLGMGSVVFGTRNGSGTRLLEVMYRAGAAIGEIPLTDHVPNLIKGTLRGLFGGDASGFVGVITSSLTNGYYVYRYLNRGDQRVQTAWTPWKFNYVTRVLAASITNSVIYQLVQMGTRVVVERINLNPDKGQLLDIRLDHRLDETDATIVPGSGNKVWQIALPYPVEVADRAGYLAVDNEDDNTGRYRGKPLTLTWINSTTVQVKHSSPNGKFFFGAKISAWKRLSPLHIQTEGGTLYPGDIIISGITVSHVETTTYTVSVRNKAGVTIPELPPKSYNGRVGMNPEVPNYKQPKITGNYQFEIGAKASEVEIYLINDTIYPSCWSGMDYHYSLVKR